MQDPSTKAAPPPRPAFARHAASLLLWREGPGGPEVLMGMRGARHRFMPNRLVFPGGAVDAADATAACAEEPRPDVLALLARNARPRLARAVVAAAARELLEETGLGFGAPPRLDGIDYLCRAVTPPSRPIRFNARFMVAPAHDAHGTLAGSGELEGLRFYPVAEALALDIMLVTREVLGRFVAWLSLPEAERRGRSRVEVFRQQVWRRE